MATEQLMSRLMTPLFNLRTTGEHKEAGLQVIKIKVDDRYTKRRYALERRLLHGFTDAVQAFLKSNPSIDFDHRFNLARILVYLPPGLRAMSAYMPGGFATYHVLSPETKRMVSGKKVDTLTRGMLRHAKDAIGVRARSYVLTWLVHRQVASLKQTDVSWLSLASGSGQPVYDTIDSLAKVNFTVTITDRDQALLDFANKVYGLERPHVKKINFEQLDVGKKGAVASQMLAQRANLVDAMGLFEYLDSVLASQLIGEVYQSLPAKGQLVFTNMSDENPHLDLLQRGLGWPDLIPRSVANVAAIFNDAKVPFENITVYSLEDKVYNIFAVRKA